MFLTVFPAVLKGLEQRTRLPKNPNPVYPCYLGKMNNLTVGAKRIKLNTTAQTAPEAPKL